MKALSVYFIAIGGRMGQNASRFFFAERRVRHVWTTHPAVFGRSLTGFDRGMNKPPRSWCATMRRSFGSRFE